MKIRPAKSRILRYALLALSLLFLFSSLASASEDELTAIKHAIKAKGARWVAGETSVSKLSPEARKKRAGALRPFLREEDHKAAAEEQAALAAGVAPPSYDWRQADGAAVNYVTPVKNQGGCGSCWAFATTAAQESQVLILNNSPAGSLDLAEQTLVSCSNAGNCGGGYINTASDYIRDLGLPLEDCFPYTATNNSCPNACSGWENNAYHLTGWHWVATTHPTVDALKNALYAYGPLVTMMCVYSDFFYYQNGIYTHTDGTFQGWHCLLIVGYDDAGQYFTVKNSWGTGWGEAGYFRIAYSEFNHAVEFGDYTIAYEGADPGNPIDDPPPPPPPDCTYALSPTGHSFKAAGGSGSVTVSTQSACAWTAVSNVEWVTVTAGDTGTGSGTVSYAVAANPSTSQRSGTLTIAGQTFTVKQRALRNKRGKK